MSTKYYGILLNNIINKPYTEKAGSRIASFAERGL